MAAPAPSSRTGYVRKCRACATAGWTCRVCGIRVCEHLCSRKAPDGTAVCWACRGKPK